MPSVQLEQGTIHYEEAGSPAGRPAVCVAGYLMGGDLWAQLGERLAGQGLRVLMPSFPTGAHREAMRQGADVSPAGVARIVASFIEALGLEDVVLVGNDTGGAISQVVAARHPERLGALVLTNCDAFEEFPPGLFKALVRAAKIPGALRAGLQPLRTAVARRSPVGYGLLSHADVDDLAKRWVEPVLRDKGVFDDLRRFTAAIDPELTLEAARTLASFDRPVLLAWGVDDTLFSMKLAERLRDAIPGARLERIEGSRTLPMVDQPERLAEVIGEFLAAGSGPASGAGHAAARSDRRPVSVRSSSATAR